MTPPVEAILVIFGRSSLFLFWKLLDRYEKSHHFWAHARWRSLWRLKNDISSAQLLYGRTLRSQLLTHPTALKQEWREQRSTLDKAVTSLMAKAKTQHDEHARPLSILAPGAVVCVQYPRTKRWDMIAEVIEQMPSGRSYAVKTESGWVFWRNRRFLRLYLVSWTFSLLPPPPFWSVPQSQIPRRGMWHHTLLVPATLSGRACARPLVLRNTLRSCRYRSVLLFGLWVFTQCWNTPSLLVSCEVVSCGMKGCWHNSGQPLLSMGRMHNGCP